VNAQEQQFILSIYQRIFMFDISALDTKTAANEGCEFEVQHPATLDGTGLLITVLGEDSEAYRKITHHQQQRRLKRALASRKGSAGANDALEDLDDDQLEILAACTKAWRMKDDSDVKLDGKPLPCTAENARALYERFPVIRAQAERTLLDRANFTQRSASS
jgi:uncharacterized membrane protein YcgQ (UPF0703/DUF1980 family)